MTLSKYILVIDAVLILGSLLLIAGYVGYTQPFATAPLEDSSTILFSFSGGNSVLIDTDLSFGSPGLHTVGDSFSLNPGTYYWKVVFNGVSDVRSVTLESPTTFLLTKSDDGALIVINSGLERVSVTTYNRGNEVGTTFVSNEDLPQENS